MRSFVVLVLALALGTLAVAPSSSSAPLPSGCSSALKPGSDCEGTVCVTWDAIPWVGGCAVRAGDVCDGTPLCRPCTCPPVQSMRQVLA